MYSLISIRIGKYENNREKWNKIFLIINLYFSINRKSEYYCYFIKILIILWSEYDRFFYYLQAAGAEMMISLQGECDDYIGFEYRKRKSFAIISNDTDFLIFPGIKVIFPRLMTAKYEKDKMKLPFIDNKNSGKIFTIFDKFECPILTQDKILRILEVKTIFSELYIL